jgi:hypothetical protein
MIRVDCRFSGNRQSPNDPLSVDDSRLKSLLVNCGQLGKVRVNQITSARLKIRKFSIGGNSPATSSMCYRCTLLKVEGFDLLDRDGKKGP